MGDLLSDLSAIRGRLSSISMRPEVIDAADRYSLHPDQISRYLEVLGAGGDVDEFLGVMEDDLPRTIRVNTLRISRDELLSRLIEKGAAVEPLKYVPYGISVKESPIALAAYHEHLLGLYYIQGPASMLPAMALGAEGASKIADSCSGVGGKTTQIAQHNRNAPITAVDISERKLMALKANVSRLGTFNVAAYLMDARELDSMGQFDRILLDAPCTGEGLMPYSRGRRGREEGEVIEYAMLQAELLTSALRALEEGGSLVYSTCSINFEENELVVSEALKEYGGDVEVVDSGLPYGDPGITEYAGLQVQEELRRCRRYFPHRHHTEGFTICRMRRVG